MDVTKLSALELGSVIKRRELSVEEAVKAQLLRIEELEGEYHCYITVAKEEALRSAKEVQEKLKNGEFKNSLLAGVPMAVKDNICTKGIVTTAGSKMLADFTPFYEAAVIKRLKEAGAVIIGKTNMDEFGMGSSGETSYFGVTKNPYDTSCIPGGSSAGSAAAVALSEAYYALGTDTGGSIRQPSSFCGVVGLKPTYGLVSRYGLIAYASSFDQIGPIGKCVADVAAVTEIIAGYDSKDATSVNARFGNLQETLGEDLKGMKAGVLALKGVHPSKEIRNSISEACSVLLRNGMQVEEIEFGFDFTECILSSYYIIASAEASSNLARYDGVRYGFRTKEYETLLELYEKSRTEGFGEEVKRRIMLGAFVLSSEHYEVYYQNAMEVREKVKFKFDKLLSEYDIMLMPVTPYNVPKIGEWRENPLFAYQGDVFTVLANLTGYPALSLPWGFDERGLPVGVQLMGRAFGEKDILQAAYFLEECEKKF